LRACSSPTLKPLPHPHLAGPVRGRPTSGERSISFRDASHALRRRRSSYIVVVVVNAHRVRRRTPYAVCKPWRKNAAALASLSGETAIGWLVGWLAADRIFGAPCGFALLLAAGVQQQRPRTVRLILMSVCLPLRRPTGTDRFASTTHAPLCQPGPRREAHDHQSAALLALGWLRHHCWWVAPAAVYDDVSENFGARHHFSFALVTDRDDTQNVRTWWEVFWGDQPATGLNKGRTPSDRNESNLAKKKLADMGREYRVCLHDSSRRHDAKCAPCRYVGK
jgi:hypothetical protein